jgi:hypothetical protein
LALTVAGTSGGVPYFSGASTWASSAALASNALVVGGGAGAAPATVTTGTGVVTALGVNTGTAGAFVVNGGDLGTPSGGVVTNLTGTGSININGTVGATTPTTGVFTTAKAIAASTQDAVQLQGRAGGTSSYAATITPTTLTASRTVTLPDANINFATGLPVANGGTGLTAGTSGGVPYFSGAAAISSSAALTANGVVYGGGTGAAPAATAAGTTGQFLGANTGGAPTWQTPTAGAAGSNTQVQFNDGGTALGGDAGLTYNKTTDDLTILGNLVIGTSGKGIDFSATPGTGTSELLADYEEGTWTPVLASGGTTTYTTQRGNYVKVGKTVWVELFLAINSVGGGSTNTISNLPYASAAASAMICSYFTGLGQSVVFVTPRMASATIEVFALTAAGNTCSTVATIFANGTNIYIAGTYIV